MMLYSHLSYENSLQYVIEIGPKEYREWKGLLPVISLEGKL